MDKHIDTIVAGGGQAGLSVSWHLKQANREHLIIDRGKIGDTWRRRWDSFCLVSPNWCCKLSGFAYDGDDPNGFMQRDEIVDYIERYAASFDPPYYGGIEITRISASNKNQRFNLETSAGKISCNNLIVTTGTHQHQKIPAWGSNLPAGVKIVHTRDYKNPSQLEDGAVLVVGSGQSGCQIADDLLRANRKVHLCVGNAGRTPRCYRGRDIFEWGSVSGVLNLTVDDHPLGHEIRFKPHPHMSGRDGGRTIDLRQMALDGAKLHGRLLDTDGANVYFADDLVEKLDRIDKQFDDELREIDAYIEENGLDAPVNELVPVKWQPEVEPLILNLQQEKISTVIFATGFHFDFSWIELPVFDERGYPRYDRGVTEIPGLYFTGLHWLHTLGSGLFYQIGRDAGYVVDHLINANP